MVDGGGWWMVEKKVLRFLSKLAHFYFKINNCVKFSTDLFWFTKFCIMTDGGRKRKGNTNAGLQPQKIVKLSQFQAISTEKYYTQVFWKDYLAFPVCSRLNSSHGVPADEASCIDGRMVGRSANHVFRQYLKKYSFFFSECFWSP